MGFQLEGVALERAHGLRALDAITLRAAPGERLALIGPSGAGKTTLLSILATALPPSEGRVQVLGHTIEAHKPPARTLRARIGWVHQSPPIPPRQRVVTAILAARLGQWSALKGLASLVYPQDMVGAREQLARVQMQDKLFARCDQLSGGQLARVGVARALYQRPDLLLADEPVAALDPALALATVRLLVQDAQERGATLVASLHAVDLALACFDRIVGLRSGRIAFDLPAQAVTPEALQALYAGEADAAQHPSGMAWPPKPSTGTGAAPPPMAYPPCY